MIIIRISTTLLSQKFSALIEDFTFPPPHTYSPYPLFLTGSGVHCRQYEGLEFANMLDIKVDIQKDRPRRTHLYLGVSIVSEERKVREVGVPITSSASLSPFFL